jgi:hypothetical protein
MAKRVPWNKGLKKGMPDPTKNKCLWDLEKEG